MNPSGLDRTFAGSIPQLYQQYLVPLLFDPYAYDLAWRTALGQPSSVLELAAGTGAATRQLADLLPAETTLVATDLNQAMLDHAASVGAARPIEWRQADALELPFPDATFDAVVCQFGAMFFPDKARGFAQARRVLRPGGRFLFNVWDRIEDNELADTVTEALAGLFPDDPPRFLARLPHGYHELAVVARDLQAGGFTRIPECATVTERGRANSPRIPALAYCEGTPLRNEIEARDPSRLAEATDVATAAIARRFGDGAVDSRIQAHIIVVER